MNRKFKNITSILLLLVFLLPSFVKIEHHHGNLADKGKSEKSSPVLYGKCGICNFDFYVFLTDIDNINLQNKKPLVNYCNNYYSLYYSNLSQFSYLLRAPPGSQI